jgi:hypothetical protein
MQVKRIYLTKDQHLQWSVVGWLRIHRPGTGSAAGGHPTSLEPYQSGTGRTS